MNGPRSWAVAVCAAAVLGCSSVASADEVARPQRATPVDADHGTVVWSAYDAAAGGFRLMVGRGGGGQRALPAGVSPTPFDADVGDDAQGRRVVVYAACPSGPPSCDVHVIRLADGTDAPVSAAARPGVAERAPTVSRGRVVWTTGGGSSAQPRVWLSSLEPGSSAVALPALPRRRCGVHFDLGPRCEPVNGSMGDLELRGDTLAQVASTLHLDSRGGELRLVSLRTGRSRQVTSFGAGESGQALIGLSIDSGAVYAYKTCFGDPGGCLRRAGTFRYDLDHHRLELAEDRRQLSGFSVDGGRAFRAEGAERLLCELEQGAYPGVPGAQIGPCPIEVGALPTQWTTVPAPRKR